MFEHLKQKSFFTRDVMTKYRTSRRRALITPLLQCAARVERSTYKNETNVLLTNLINTSALYTRLELESRKREKRRRQEEKKKEGGKIKKTAYVAMFTGASEHDDDDGLPAVR